MEIFTSIVMLAFLMFGFLITKDCFRPESETC